MIVDGQLSPIVLFVFNRLWHTKQTIEALQKNDLAAESELFIYSDGSKVGKNEVAVNEVRSYAMSITGFKTITIIKREKNWGLAASIVDGVSEIVNKYGKIIVLEDDLVTSPCFLKYMNSNLNLYATNQKVASIHGYIYPISNLPDSFFIRGADCWGWATWSRAWKEFDADGRSLLNQLKANGLEYECEFNGRYGYTKMLSEKIKGNNDSWAIRWYVSDFLKDMLKLYPGKTYVKNIGNDNSGTHCSTSLDFDSELNLEFIQSEIQIKESDYNRKKFNIYFRSLKKNVFIKLYNKIFK